MESATSVVRIKTRGTSGSTFTVELSDGSFFYVGSDFLLEKRIVKGLEVDEILMAAFRLESEVLECREKAMQLIAMREHAAYELEVKLRKRNFPLQTIHKVISRLRELGLLDDYRFAEKRCLSRSRTKNWGRRKIQAELFSLGVGTSVANSVVRECISDKMELEALLRAWEKLQRRRKGSGLSNSDCLCDSDYASATDFNKTNGDGNKSDWSCDKVNNSGSCCASDNAKATEFAPRTPTDKEIAKLVARGFDWGFIKANLA